jgi:hypothetical protein
MERLRDWVLKVEVSEFEDMNDFVVPKQETNDFVVPKEETNDFVVPKQEVIIEREEITVSMSAADEQMFTSQFEEIPWGEFHDQGDAKWMIIRRSLWSHNNTPCGRPAYQPPGVWPPAGRNGWFRYY